MEYFAGLDVSMEETHVCVVDRDGSIVHQAKVPSTPADLAAELANAPACRRVLFETGRMAPMLYHGLRARGLPVVCVESRQAYQALKSLTTLGRERLQGLVSLPALDTDHRQPARPQAVVEHRSHPAGLEQDAAARWRVGQLGCEVGWRRGHLGLVHDRTVSVDDADVRLLHRDVQARKILHGRSPLAKAEPILAVPAEELPPITQC